MLSVMTSGGFMTPRTTNSTNDSNKKGVRNLPIISTVLVFEIDNRNTVPKNRIAKTTLLNEGKDGCTPISNTVAPVRGIATNGPIHKMISIANTLINFG
ncbi:hypothetical protein CCAND95_200046 [Capnocytophaga canis]|uniref:Uncharacterized protein n=1 Tax=Capnocytophaga canis TaxID=1848903 RepID=A0A0B7HY52_9FLAO|nr:hypothetical protein CCAND95_200046 [Capnocytophaga canis]CEN44606.1 hypothetical protein CCAND38_190010 [Capnocytophaga canis]CEN51719.1 hypothetical protein CCAND93_180027 [Capnocytophaga canis]